MFFSGSTNGFYDTKIHSANIPPDAVEITREQHAELLEGQAKGNPIGADLRGYPTLGNQPTMTESQLIFSYENALDEMLDAVAKSYRYADRTRLALRASYPNHNQALAIAFGTWMDSCNDKAKQLYLDVKAGNVQMPTLEQFIAGFPPFNAP